jgi:hypothetical protein
MMNLPEGRFVKLRTAIPARPPFSMTMTMNTPASPLTRENHGLLAYVAAKSPEKTALAAKRLEDLLAQSDVFFTWLEASPSHSTLFVTDPVAAIYQALPNLPADFFDVWRP